MFLTILYACTSPVHLITCIKWTSVAKEKFSYIQKYILNAFLEEGRRLPFPVLQEIYEAYFWFFKRLVTG